MDINKLVVEKILKVAKEQNLTMEDLFNATKRDRKYFDDVMSCKEDIDIFMFFRICKLFKISSEDFFKEFNDMRKKIWYNTLMKIGIIGLGLIGGSIFKALSEFHEVVGISHSQKGLQENITDEISALKDCDIVFVATHMNKTVATLEQLNEILDEDTVVADVCSLKEFLADKTYNFNFVPTHPMAGTEKTGFENSFKELFNGAKWVVCKKQCPENLKKVIEQMGAQIIFASPKEHDEAAALISHMPMVIAQAIFKSAEGNDLALKLASSGFRDMTRLAISNEEMAQDMVNMNYENIQNALLKLYSSVGDLIKNDYRNEVCDIRKQRLQMYKDGKNIL